MNRVSALCNGGLYVIHFHGFAWAITLSLVLHVERILHKPFHHATLMT